MLHVTPHLKLEVIIEIVPVICQVLGMVAVADR